VGGGEGGVGGGGECSTTKRVAAPRGQGEREGEGECHSYARGVRENRSGSTEKRPGKSKKCSGSAAV